MVLGVGIEPTSPFRSTAYQAAALAAMRSQDKLDLRVGLEPTFPDSKSGGLPLADQRINLAEGTVLETDPTTGATRLAGGPSTLAGLPSMFFKGCGVRQKQ